MKNKKSVLICFAILALLCLGIGFATLTDTLTIGGNVTSAGALDSDEEHIPSAFDIIFTNVESEKTVDQASGIVITTPAYDQTADTASFTVQNMKVNGDKVIIKYTIKNNVCPDGYKAQVSLTNSLTVGGNVTATCDAYFNTVGTTSVDLALNDEAVVYVVITLTETLAASTDALSITGNVILKATAVTA